MTELKVRAEQLGIWMIAFSAIFNTDCYHSQIQIARPECSQQFNAQPRKSPSYTNQPSYKTRCVKLSLFDVRTLQYLIALNPNIALDKKLRLNN